MAFKTNFKDEIPLNGERLYGGLDKNGAYVFRDVRMVRTNGNTQEGDTFGAAEVNEIGKFLNGTSHRNLVLNGDFQVWQRGTSFVGIKNGTYCADRWKTYTIGTSGSVNIEKASNGLKVSGNFTGTINIYQVVDATEYSWLIGKKTIVTICKNGKETFLERIQSASGNQISLVSINGLRPNDVINYVKVELGEVPSTHVPNPYFEELRLCQPYYTYFAGTFGLTPFWTNGRNDSLQLDLVLPAQMKWAPTLDITRCAAIDMLEGTIVPLDNLKFTVHKLENTHLFILIMRKDGNYFNSNNWVLSDLAIALDKEIY